MMNTRFKTAIENTADIRAEVYSFGGHVEARLIAHGIDTGLRMQYGTMTKADKELRSFGMERKEMAAGPDLLAVYTKAA